jgi:molecular chaperone DnaK
VSSDPQPIVAGVITSDEPKDVEIKFDAEGGHWTSGWMQPSNKFFESSVTLSPSDVTTFWIYARDAQGKLLVTDPAEFRIRHGLVPSAPPLPHTLSFEVVSSDGKAILDPVFSKGTPLPAEKTVQYRAAHAINPDRPETSLAIKLWEGEYLDDPDTNDWVTNLLLAHDGIKRTLPEGAEIEVSIKISSSRLIDVSAFVPLLNQHFTNNVYLPQREEQDYSALSRATSNELRAYKAKLEDLDSTASDDPALQAQVAELRKELSDLQTRSVRTSDGGKKLDPDDARRLVDESKSIKGRIGRVERKVSAAGGGVQSLRFAQEVELAEAVVADFGSPLDKAQLAAYKRELERLGGRGDEKAIGRLTEDIEQLRWRVVLKQDWYWVDVLDRLAEPGADFSDRAAANVLIESGRAAAMRGEGQGLRDSVRALWKLQPKSNSDALRERALESGLRKF